MTEQESARAIGLELACSSIAFEMYSTKNEVAQSAGLGQSLNDLADLCRARPARGDLAHSHFGNWFARASECQIRGNRHRKGASL